jgi:hypothetical protein
MRRIILILTILGGLVALGLGCQKTIKEPGEPEHPMVAP